MRVLLAVLLVGITGCGGEDNSPGDVATPSSPAVTPVKAENAEAGAPKTKPVNSEDVSEAEPKDLAQERTETPTDVPSDSSSDEAVAAPSSPVKAENAAAGESEAKAAHEEIGAVMNPPRHGNANRGNAQQGGEDNHPVENGKSEPHAVQPGNVSCCRFLTHH